MHQYFYVATSIFIYARASFDMMQQVVANNGPPSEALLKEHRAVNNVSIDESPGKEFRRHTHLALERAPGSKDWIYAYPRHKQDLDTVKRFADKRQKAGGPSCSF